MFTPLLDKLAEPPPPDGVSVKEWDKILEKGPSKMAKTVDVDQIRKVAAELADERAFEELTSSAIGTEELIRYEKIKAAEDTHLLKIAVDLHFAEHGSDLEEPNWTNRFGDEVLNLYESMGGTYKHAFGQQMFNTQQMAGSPAVSGGMSARANTKTPQIQSAPVSVTTTSIGNQGQNNPQGGVTAPTSAPSTPSATTG